MESRLLNTVLIISLLLAVMPFTIYAAPLSQTGTEYTVQADDNLWKLAEKYWGNGALYPSIVAATNEQHAADDSFAYIENPSLIQIGWKLYVPEEAPAQMPAAAAPAAVPEIQATEADIIVDGLLYPEAPYWAPVDNKLYFVEWSGDKIWMLEDGEPQVFYETAAGAGPCGMAQDAEGNMWVAMYSSLQMVKLSPAGEVLQVIDNYEGAPFKGPNDVAIDANGGIYFTDSGDFGDDWTIGRAAGALYYITPTDELWQVDKDLHYPNGISISADGQCLYVDEHRQNRVLKYTINADGTVTDKSVFFEPDDVYLGDAEYNYELGPDGMWRDSQGNLWVAHYGGGKVMVVSPAGKLIKKVMIPKGIYPTNTTLNPAEDTLYVTEGGEGLLYRIGL